MGAGSSLIVLFATLAAACSTGGPPPPTHCEVEVAGLEHYANTAEGPNVAYRVRGVAGSGATVWLAAKVGSGEWISGYGAEVGPGPFEAIVELKLTGIPREYAAVLEVAGHRCRARAPDPRD